MRRRFFVEGFQQTSAILRGESAEHLGRVLRAEPGQLYELSDGRSAWLGRIERVALARRGESCIEFALVEPLKERQQKLRIVLLIALVKFDRFEWCLEKAVELGASEIVPLAAARTEKALIAASAKRRARWEKILLASSQQCRRLSPPILRMSSSEREAGIGTAAKPDSAFLDSAADCKIILSERRDAGHIDMILERASNCPVSAGQRTVALAIGPEGGWTDAEIAAARAGSFAEASLGESILRTETAVIASLAIIGFALC